MMGEFQRFALGSVCISLILFCIPLAAQTPVMADSAPGAAASQPSPAPRLLANSNTKLGTGDLIEVSVFGVPDLASKARVSSTGDVYLPLIDYVHVADLTTDEAQNLIQKRLEDGGFVRNPHVTIFVTESTSQAITMAGEVSHPGTYASVGDRRLYDLISMAGGLTDRAGRNVVIIHRDDPDHKVEVQLSRNLAEDTKGNVEVEAGDTIIVSRAGIVYVVGDVGHPSGFVVEDDTLTVLKALALAGGHTRSSSLNG